MATPTASGKSLCYNLPVLQAVAEDPAARALYLFPTKALGRDQLAEVRELASLAELELEADVYDGDTPAPIRSRIRAAGQVVVTNPDMLHAAILPHHTKWFQLFEQLRYIVIDEAHTLPRRLRQPRRERAAPAGADLRPLRLDAPDRAAARRPSATRASSAEPLTGRPLRVIDRNGAPTGEKHVVVLDPPGHRHAHGRPAGASGLARRAALTFLRAGRQTIVFGRSRVQVELLLTSLREAMRDGRGPIDRVRGYRGGYLPSERRAIEAGLRTGDILGVVSTNALELGIDIGRLDVAVLAGYPGTIAGTWQQIGRAGRRQGVSVAILVAGAGPLDRYVAANPEYLFEGLPEEARLDPENIHVLLAHLRAATFELPFEARRGVRPGDRRTTCWRSWPRRGTSARRTTAAGTGRARTSPPRRSASGWPRRRTWSSSTPGPTARGSSARWTCSRAPTLVHEDAIYLHESRQYHVDRLDWGERKAYVRPVDVDHYTQAELAVTLKPLEVFAEERSRAWARGADRAHGEVMVSTLATIYKKLKLDTHENLGWGRIHLPETELAQHRLVAGAGPRVPPPAGVGTTLTARSWAPAARSRRWPACCS